MMVSLLEFIQSRYVYVAVRSHDGDYWPNTMASCEVANPKALRLMKVPEEAISGTSAVSPDSS